MKQTQTQAQAQEQKKDTQARDWIFVVNNPVLTEQEMNDYLKTLVNVRYFIFSREKGDAQTETRPAQNIIRAISSFPLRKGSAQ